VISIDPDDDDKTEWEIFKAQFGKNYDSLEAERAAFQNYLKNQIAAAKASTKSAVYGSNEEPAKFGVNKFSDVAHADFLKNFTGHKNHSNHTHGNHSKKYTAVELGASAGVQSVDWSQTQYITPVRNQGQCGSCWTFASTATLESYYAIVTGNPAQYFSTQELIDCVTDASGCDGGNAETAYDFVIKNGIVFDSKYSYQGQAGTCNSQSFTPDFQIDSQGSVTTGDENAIIAALQNQPLAVAVNANQNWQNYKSGILAANQCDPSQVNHAVTLVGYTDTYWKIKNSWGEDWGEAGYIRLARGDTCGVTQDVSWPIKNGVSQTVTPTPTPTQTPTPTPAPVVVCSDRISCCGDLNTLGYCNVSDQTKFETGYCKQLFLLILLIF